MRCKNLLAILPGVALCLVATRATAQEGDPPAQGAERKEHVLIGPGTRHGAYFAPEMKVTSFTRDYAILAGGQVSWIIDRRYVVGLAGYGLTTAHSPVPALSSPTTTTRIGFGYGGLRLAYVFAPEKPAHVSFGALIGAGGVTAIAHDRMYEADGSSVDRLRAHHGAAVLVAEPQTDLELNLHSKVRVAVTVGYRFVSSTDQPGFKASDLSGPAAGIGLRIGLF
jgi:hypothetical protein